MLNWIFTQVDILNPHIETVRWWSFTGTSNLTRPRVLEVGEMTTLIHCHLMAVIDYSSSFQNSLMAASAAAAAYCFQVYYCHENHLFHPAKGAPQKRDDLHGKKGTLLVPFLRCPPSILMGNGGGTPPPPSLFTGAQSFIAYTMSPSLQRRMIRHIDVFHFRG